MALCAIRWLWIAARTAAQVIVVVGAIRRIATTLLHGWYSCLFKLVAVCFQPQEQIKRPGCAQPGGEYLNAAIGVNDYTRLVYYGIDAS